MVNTKGQSLIELIVALTLIVVVITMVTVVTVNGLKNSQYSKNQVTATKFAQEGIEKVRELRNKNYAVCSAGYRFPNGLWDTGLNCPAPGCTFSLAYSGICGTVSDPFFVNVVTPTQVESLSANGVSFTRTIMISNSTTINGAASFDVRNINVIVSWRDTSGVHSSNLTTVMSKY